jgi:hypothetical protein
LKELKKGSIFALAFGEYPMRHSGEMAEWSNAAVLKTVEGHTSGGSNPSFSAKGNLQRKLWVFLCSEVNETCFSEIEEHKKSTREAGLGFYACLGIPNWDHEQSE